MEPKEPTKENEGYLGGENDVLEAKGRKSSKMLVKN